MEKPAKIAAPSDSQVKLQTVRKELESAQADLQTVASLSPAILQAAQDQVKKLMLEEEVLAASVQQEQSAASVQPTHALLDSYILLPRSEEVCSGF